MSEYREPVNRVKAISGDTKDPKTLHAHFESAATDVDRQVLASAPQAAQAIERLEREGNEREKQYADLLASHEEDLEALEKAEQQLADARAEIERMDRVFERIAEANVLDMDTLHPDGIQQEARQARREAFERACKAQCKKCRTTGLSTYDSRLREWGHHGYDFVRCDAVFIRALMDEESTSNEPSE